MDVGLDILLGQSSSRSSPNRSNSNRISNLIDVSKLAHRFQYTDLTSSVQSESSQASRFSDDLSVNITVLNNDSDDKSKGYSKLSTSSLSSSPYVQGELQSPTPFITLTRGRKGNSQFDTPMTNQSLYSASPLPSASKYYHNNIDDNDEIDEDNINNETNETSISEDI
jgi:hypothetical protein